MKWIIITRYSYTMYAINANIYKLLNVERYVVGISLKNLCWKLFIILLSTCQFIFQSISLFFKHSNSSIRICFYFISSYNFNIWNEREKKKENRRNWRRLYIHILLYQKLLHREFNLWIEILASKAILNIFFLVCPFAL